MNKLKYLAVFAAGGLMGSAVTYQCIKKYYEERANEEIESVKEMMAHREQNAIENLELANNLLKESAKEEVLEDEEEFDEEDIDEAEDIIEHYDYSNPSLNNKEVTPVGSAQDKPFIISPDEFDELAEHEIVSLTYWADGYLTTDEEEPELIEDIAGTVGEDFAEHFGEYEDDSVFVRNTRLLTDYEILRDERGLKEMMAERRAQYLAQDYE